MDAVELAKPTVTSGKYSQAVATSVGKACIWEYRRCTGQSLRRGGGRAAAGAATFCDRNVLNAFSNTAGVTKLAIELAHSPEGYLLSPAYAEAVMPRPARLPSPTVAHSLARGLLY
jgi:hypothetical protein